MTVFKSIIFFILFIGFSFSSYAQINQPYGLFFIQDNELKEGQKIFEAPTLKTDVDVNVQGLLTTTTVRQYFINPTKEHTEAIYLFPLPDKAGVDHLRMQIGDRFINGLIQKKKEAEKTYQQAKNSGKKTSLISSSRTNIFKTKLANIEPGEMIVVEIRYQDKLSLINGEYNIRIPTVITHRYVKGSSAKINANEAKFIPLNPDLHSPINESEDFTVNPYSINIDLNVGFNISSTTSNNDLNIQKISPSHYTVNLAEGTMPSTKDFVLKFQPLLSKDPYVQIYSEQVGDDTYLYGLINPQISLNDLVLTDKSSITILADVSGSMSGSSLTQMKSTLIDFINQLPEYHYINIIAFDDNHYKLFNLPKIANQHTKLTALKFIKKFKADKGTEMLGPIYEAILEKTPLPLDHHIILMTDGAISYEREALAIVHEYIGDKKFHVVGIGSSPNSYLVKDLAKTGRGSYLFVDDSSFKKETQDLLFKINRPVLKNLRLFVSDEHYLLPNKLPDVLAGDPINFFIKVPNTVKEELNYPIVLEADHKNGLWKFEIDKTDIQSGYNLNKLWAKEKIDEIMFHNAIGFLDAGTYERKITDLALEHSLVTKFTSLVAVDDQISRKQEDLLTTHQIPQNIPDGWVEPNIPNLKDSSSNRGLQSLAIPSLMTMDELEEVDSNSKFFQLHFVQTSTYKQLYYLVGSLFFILSIFLFISRRKFY